MASLDPNQEEQQNNQQPQSAPAGGPVQVSGTAGATSSSGQGASPATTSAVSQQVPQTNQGFTDVSAYIDANRPGTQQMGQQVASNLTQNYNKTQGDISNSANNIYQQVSQGYTPENTQLIQQVAANPTAASQDQVSSFQKQLNDSYSGPSSWADYGNLQGEVATAQQQGNLINTPGGLNVLAQQAEGNNTSQGINQLDALLLGGDKGAYSAIKQASDPFATLNNYLSQQNTQAQQAIQTGQQSATQAAQDARNAFTGQNGTLTNLNATINQTAADRVAQAQAQNAQISADLGKLYASPAQTASTSLGTYGGGSTPWYNTTNYQVGDLSPQDLQSLGITPEQWAGLRNSMTQAGTSQLMTGHNFGAGSPTAQIDLSQWLSQQDPTTAINAGTVATPDQYKEMGAIQNILGSQMPQGAAINPALASLAGTAPTNLNSFNYQNALQSAQQTAASERQAAQDEANALTSQADLSHAQSQHGGGFGNFLTNIVNHPLQTVSNPVSLGNTLLKGGSIVAKKVI